MRIYYKVFEFKGSPHRKWILHGFWQFLKSGILTDIYLRYLRTISVASQHISQTSLQSYSFTLLRGLFWTAFRLQLLPNLKCCWLGTTDWAFQETSSILHWKKKQLTSHPSQRNASSCTNNDHTVMPSPCPHFILQQTFPSKRNIFLH